jgi:hypothetical protein
MEEASGEVHWQDMLTMDTWYNGQAATGEHGAEDQFLRAQICKDAAYDLHMTAGKTSFPIRLATSLNSSSSDYMSCLERFRSVAASHGLNFYALALVNCRNHPLITAIRPDPPLLWYIHEASRIHDSIIDYLESEWGDA